MGRCGSPVGRGCRGPGRSGCRADRPVHEHDASRSAGDRGRHRRPIHPHRRCNSGCDPRGRDLHRRPPRHAVHDGTRVLSGTARARWNRCRDPRRCRSDLRPRHHLRRTREGNHLGRRREGASSGSSTPSSTAVRRGSSLAAPRSSSSSAPTTSSSRTSRPRRSTPQRSSTPPSPEDPAPPMPA